MERFNLLKPTIIHFTFGLLLINVFFLCIILQPEYFQDDLFPDTVKSGVPALSSNEWFRGVDKLQSKMSLRPTDMKPCMYAFLLSGLGVKVYL